VRAVIYARASAQGGARELRAQEEALYALAHQRGWSVLAFDYDEGSGARNLERPGLKGLLERVRDGDVDVVLVTSLDRLTRCVADLHRLLGLLRENNVALVSLEECLDSTTDVGALMLDVLERISQWEQVVVTPGAGTPQRPMQAGGPEPIWAPAVEQGAFARPEEPGRTAASREGKHSEPAQARVTVEPEPAVPHRGGSSSGVHDGGDLMTPEQVAERLKISRLTVMDYLRRGLLSGVKVGRLWRVQQKDLEDYLARGTKGLPS